VGERERRMERRNARPIVVTGMGIVSPAGIGETPLWAAIVEGRTTLRPVAELATTFARYGFDPGDYAGYVGAPMVEELDAYVAAHELALEHDEYFAVQPLIAAREALHAAGLEGDGRGVGLSLGSNFGQLGLLEQLVRQRRRGGLDGLPARTVAAYPFPAVARLLSRRFGLRGPSMVFSLACASSNFALGHALDLLRTGQADCLLAGGWEAIQASGLVGAYRLGVIDPQPCRPFARERMGFTPGIGAAFLVLETLRSAAARGVEPLAEIAGFGASCDAHHITSPDPDGHGMALAMRRAIDDAGITVDEVDYINAHGTGTYLNDSIETLAIKQVCGARAHAIPVSSTKSIVGHTAGASAALEAAICCLAVRRGIIPPTLHYDAPDPECDLDYVPNASRRQEITTALSNSFAFGGNNSTLVVRRFGG
jgi:3-oxoacyl-[acyl-carrier-protein] synthase II